MKLCSKSASRSRITQFFSIDTIFFFEKLAFIIAIHGQKTIQ